jgi:hypothetical protein
MRHLACLGKSGRSVQLYRCLAHVKTADLGTSASKSLFDASNYIKEAAMEQKMVLTKTNYDAPYDALMFAKTPELARKAAVALVRAVLGDEAAERPLDETLREVCREIRPSSDPKEQARYESEFVELVMGPRPAAGQQIAA